MERTRTGNRGNSARMFLISSMPFVPGKLISTIARSGFTLRNTSMACAATPHSPPTHAHHVHGLRRALCFATNAETVSGVDQLLETFAKERVIIDNDDPFRVNCFAF